ncbi:GntR family transcriptional regulator [Pseudonocardia sp. N23]|uniref:GntR family transcriptional regulator n=1 Tax=Pseudonocardia sp. N23 TaxID=1987376 RepID=UPI001C0F1EA6|nr:GntR family transcriptional regulator [Pseudonocardia sp. N23]
MTVNGGRVTLPGDTHYNRMKADLLGGRFPPGTVLHETAMSEVYGVSRTPVREALVRLAQDRLIERTTRGFVVRRRTPEEILEIYDARIALEATAAALAAERRGEFDLQLLASLHASSTAETDDAARIRTNALFHLAIRSAARNGLIGALLADLDDLLTISTPDRSLGEPPERSIGEHAELVEAIRRRDADTARAIMSTHLIRMRDLRVRTLLHERE